QRDRDHAPAVEIDQEREAGRRDALRQPGRGIGSDALDRLADRGGVAALPLHHACIHRWPPRIGGADATPGMRCGQPRTRVAYLPWCCADRIRRRLPSHARRAGARRGVLRRGAPSPPARRAGRPRRRRARGGRELDRRAGTGRAGADRRRRVRGAREDRPRRAARRRLARGDGRRDRRLAARAPGRAGAVDRARAAPALADRLARARRALLRALRHAGDLPGAVVGRGDPRRARLALPAGQRDLGRCLDAARRLGRLPCRPVDRGRRERRRAWRHRAARRARWAVRARRALAPAAPPRDAGAVGRGRDRHDPPQPGGSVRRMTAAVHASFLDDLGIETPIVQAGMAGGVARGELAGAVSAAGALGTVGMMAPRAFAGALADARRRARARPVAANLLVPFIRADHVRACAEAGAALVVLHGGLSRRWVERLRACGLRVLVTVGTPREAVRALAAGASGLVVQGSEAGGHLLGVAPLERALPQVRGAVGEVPLLAAGGIAEPADVRRALELGAAAAVAGTRFLLTEESHAHPEYRRRVLGAQRTLDTELFGIGWPLRHRVIPNAATDRWCRADERG